MIYIHGYNTNKNKLYLILCIVPILDEDTGLKVLLDAKIMHSCRISSVFVGIFLTFSYMANSKLLI